MRGSGVYSARADLWSLGLVLAELATDTRWPERLRNERLRLATSALLGPVRAVFGEDDNAAAIHALETLAEQHALDAFVSDAVAAVPQLGAVADGCLSIATAARWTLARMGQTLLTWQQVTARGYSVLLTAAARADAAARCCAQSDVNAHAEAAFTALSSPPDALSPPIDEAAAIATVRTARRLSAPQHSAVATAEALAAAMDAPERFPLAARLAAADALPQCGTDAADLAALDAVVEKLLLITSRKGETQELRNAALYGALWVRPLSQQSALQLLPKLQLIMNGAGSDADRVVAAAASRAKRALMPLLLRGVR